MMKFDMWKSDAVRIVLGCLVIFVIETSCASAAFLSATLSLEPDAGLSAEPGETVSFGVMLRDYVADDPSHAILSFSLNIDASDPALTQSQTDFSQFGFVLNSADLSGLMGGPFGVFDGDITDDGRVEFGADSFAGETGILQSHGDMRLGTLSVTAPQTPGTYDVALNVDPSDFFFFGGTYLSVDDGTFFGQTIPGDGTLTLQNSSITVNGSSAVVPEPASIVLFSFGLLGLLGGHRLRRHRADRPGR